MARRIKELMDSIENSVASIEDNAGNMANNCEAVVLAVRDIPQVVKLEPLDELLSSEFLGSKASSSY